MTWADNINGIYESVGGLFMIGNCVKVYKDKEVKGISLISAAFFCSWGYFNLYFYPSLNQWMSTLGAILMTIANTAWILMAVYYTRKNRYNSENLLKVMEKVEKMGK